VPVAWVGGPMGGVQDGFRGTVGRPPGRLRAAAIAAVALEGLLGGGGERRLSAGGGWERFEPLERSLEPM
jgi:hypothetical protein